jgi:hypothetical protein
MEYLCDITPRVYIQMYIVATARQGRLCWLKALGLAAAFLDRTDLEARVWTTRASERPCRRSRIILTAAREAGVEGRTSRPV